MVLREVDFVISFLLVWYFRLLTGDFLETTLTKWTKFLLLYPIKSLNLLLLDQLVEIDGLKTD